VIRNPLAIECNLTIFYPENIMHLSSQSQNHLPARLRDLSSDTVFLIKITATLEAIQLNITRLADRGKWLRSSLEQIGTDMSAMNSFLNALNQQGVKQQTATQP